MTMTNIDLSGEIYVHAHFSYFDFMHEIIMCTCRWITDEWSPCSKSCGLGMRERAVVCSEESNGIKVKVKKTFNNVIYI